MIATSVTPDRHASRARLGLGLLAGVMATLVVAQAAGAPAASAAPPMRGITR